MSQRALILVLAALLVVPASAVALVSTPHLATPTGETVTIKRDAYGVPHVYADSAYALFFGNGYAMAQDRFFQMDVLRHVGRGQAAEMLGPAELPIDIAARRDLYTEQERTQQWQGLPDDQRTALVGFADGVNAWINETKLDPTKLSAEEYATGQVPPSPWIPEDSVAIADYLLSVFGVGSGDQELSNAQLLLQLSHTLQGDDVEHAFHDLVPVYDSSSYSTIPANEGHFTATDSALAFSAIPALQWNVTWAAANATPFGDIKCLADRNGVAGDCKGSLSNLAQSTVDAGMPIKWGSNAALFSPALSRDGNAMLLGGPQMSYYNPMIPYEVGLHGAGYDAVGMGVGGAPGVIIGRAAHYAWTVTSGDGDQVDVVAERLVPGSPRQYYNGTSGHVTDMDCREEVHRGLPSAIDQEPPVIATQEVCRTTEGPVFAINENAGYAFVRQQTTRNDELHSGLMWLTLGREPDLNGFASHMEQFRFTFNFNYADDTGNIAYFHWGANPIRATGYDVRLPRVMGAWDWQGLRTGSQMPHIVNPQQGYTVNWNNLPEQGFPAGAAREQWGSVHRVELYDRTIHKMLDQSPDHKLGLQELAWINENISTQNPFAYKIAPYLIGASEHDADPQVQAAVDALRAWRDAGYTWQDTNDCVRIQRSLPASGDCKYAYPGQQVYEAWRANMQDALMSDELGPFVRELNFDPPTSDDPHAADAGRNDNKEVPLLNSYLGRNEHDWCAPKSCADLTHDVLVRTLGQLAAKYNTTDVSQWQEPIHRIKFSALSGGPGWTIPMVNRPSFNHLYDWGAPGTQAWSVLPPGTNQSWNPLDFARFEADGTIPGAHKTDQLVLYANLQHEGDPSMTLVQQYKPANLDPASVESTTVLHTTNVIASGPA